MEKQLENSKFEVGKWYTYNDASHIFNITEIKNDKIYGYGHSPISGWTNVTEWYDSKRIIPATDKEVEEALIKEAEKRTKGVHEITIKSLFDGSFHAFKDYRFEFVDNVLQIWDSYGWIAFMENGKWAEIIKYDFIDDLPEQIKSESIINNDYNIF